MRSTTVLSFACLVLFPGCWAPTAGELASADYGTRPSDELAQTMAREWIDENLAEPEGAIVSFGAVKQGWFRVEDLATEIRYAWQLPATINEKSSVGGFRGARPWEFFFRGPYLVGVGQPSKRLGSRGRHTIIAYRELQGVDGETGEPISTDRPGGVPDEEPVADVDVWKPTLSLELLEALVLGMSYADVVEVLGWPGDVQTDQIIGPSRIMLVLWRSEDGRKQISGLFHDDALRQRGHFGLE